MQIDFIEIYGIVFQSGFYVNRYRQMEIDSDRKIKKSKEMQKPDRIYNLYENGLDVLT